MYANIKKQAIAQGKKLGLTGAALALFVQQALAAVPTTISDAIATAQTDTSTVATSVVVMGFVIWGIRYLLKGK